MRRLGDGAPSLDHHAADDAIRAAAPGRTNRLPAGGDECGRRAPPLRSILATCTAAGVEPFAYLEGVVAHVQRNPQSQVCALTPVRSLSRRERHGSRRSRAGVLGRTAMHGVLPPMGNNAALSQPADRARIALARGAVRLVALLVLIAGVAKFVDVGLPPASGLHYDRPTLAAIGTLELLLAGFALWRPERRAALLLTTFLVCVTAYVLLLPPGDLERVGCSCFVSRFRFQDVRTHIRLNGALILLGVFGAVGSSVAQPAERTRGVAAGGASD